MAENAKFWNKIAEKYAKKPVPNEAVYQKKLQIAQQYLNKAMSVLEFGCGTGSTALIHAPYVNNYLATDISNNMLEIAEEKLAQSDIDNLRFEITSLEQLSSPSESFDAILAMSIIHLVDDPKANIERSYDLLAPNGVFISSTPCVSGLWKALKLVLPIARPLGLLPNVHFFSHNQLISDITRPGFIIEKQWVPEESKMTSFIIARKP